MIDRVLSWFSHDLAIVHDGEKLWVNRRDTAFDPIDSVYLPEPPLPIPEHITGDTRDALTTRLHLGEAPETRPQFKHGEFVGDSDQFIETLRQALRGCSGTFPFVAPRAVISAPFTSLGTKACWLDYAEKAGVRRVYLASHTMTSAIGLDIPVVSTTGTGVVIMHRDITAYAVIAFAGELCEGSIPLGYDQLRTTHPDNPADSPFLQWVSDSILETMDESLRDRHLESLADNGFVFCSPGIDGAPVADRLTQLLQLPVADSPSPTPPALEGIKAFLGNIDQWRQDKVGPQGK